MTGDRRELPEDLVGWEEERESVEREGRSREIEGFLRVFEKMTHFETNRTHPFFATCDTRHHFFVIKKNRPISPNFDFLRSLLSNILNSHSARSFETHY